MSKLEYLWWCFVLAVVMGGSWGGLLFWFNELLGISIGLFLFLLTFLFLLGIDGEKEDEQPNHNRRFNDL